MERAPKDAGGENRGHGGRLKDGAEGGEGERWSRRGATGTRACQKAPTPTVRGQERMQLLGWLDGRWQFNQTT